MTIIKQRLIGVACAGAAPISSDIGAVGMSDVLVRGLSEETLAKLDEVARGLGISRNEYLRRALERMSGSVPAAPAMRADLEWFSQAFVDLGDPEVMKGAWS